MPTRSHWAGHEDALVCHPDARRAPASRRASCVVTKETQGAGPLPPPPPLAPPSRALVLLARPLVAAASRPGPDFEAQHRAALPVASAGIGACAQRSSAPGRAGPEETPGGKSERVPPAASV